MKGGFGWRCRLVLTGSLLFPILLLLSWPWTDGDTRLALLLASAGFHGWYLLGTLRPCTGWFGPVVKGFSSDEKELWLTFDDGPDPGLTPALLALLAEHGVRATFFVIGERAARHPELIRAIRDAGHELANHSYAHPSAWYWCLPWTWLSRDLKRCHEVLEVTGGQRPQRFRPPVGMFSPSLGISLESESLQVIGWGARGFDAGGGSAQQIFQRIQPVLRPGAIVLLHPERRPEALQALELLLKWIKDHGYRCVIPSVERLNAEARGVCAW